MYCCDSDATDIEHFWPKSAYPERMFRWPNLLLCCTECGRFKGDRFPLEGGESVLVDPSADDPWRFLDFDPATGNIAPRFDLNANDWFVRGVKTVEVLQLDRREALSSGYQRTHQRLKVIRNRVEPDAKTRSAYKNPNNDPRGPWRLIPMTGAELRPNQQYAVKTPSGKIIFPPEGRHWLVLEDKFLDLVAQGKVFFGKSGDSQPGLIRYYSEIEGLVPWTWWPHEEVGHTDESKKEIHALFGKVNAFDTPKPERLLKRVIGIATNPGDLVLDSFAGSGTTGAVAHKMGRRWIMVELGEHCHTHIIPRLKKVIDGEDKGGITEAVGWKGGGGFRYYRLAPSLLEKDKWGNWVIHHGSNPAMLAEALCKLEGFTYAPGDSLYWQHGHSTEPDYIYVTTAHLSHEQLQALSDEVGPERSLLVLCTAFRGRGDYPNLTVKKIPKQVLSRCE